jgi:protein phosphatase 2C family protein 2/3
MALSESGENIEQFTGPLRVFPGRLSTTRAFGDLEAKHIKYNGNPNVVIS